ncbi:MAG: RluA family pseudouridine synthase [Mediterranea sp.]|nr:RluA family pseudouridine synthase [Mediterranea sp.]
MIHRFRHRVTHIAPPDRFTYPFHYTPHPLCVLATEEVKAYLARQARWREEIDAGKMFGVLAVRTTEGDIGYLVAFSGNLAGENIHAGFVPPVYDMLRPGEYFKEEEAEISAINRRIEKMENDPHYLDSVARNREEVRAFEAELEQAKATMKAGKEARDRRRQTPPKPTAAEEAAMIRESQFQKAEVNRISTRFTQRSDHRLSQYIADQSKRVALMKSFRKRRSAALQRWLFAQFRMRDAKGGEKNLLDIFERSAHKLPPAGAGECALPKLLQYAYLNGLKPLAMAEFWWGRSPEGEVRHHGYYYPSCQGKCGPILAYMLQGLDVDDNPLSPNQHQGRQLDLVFEDADLVVVNKPAGMLSVPGKGEDEDSVYARLRTLYPEATGPMVAHRLDMATSGLMVAAKTKEAHQRLQEQFERREVKKRYVALLEGTLPDDKLSGRVELPLCPDPLDRPRQRVSYEHGKPAVTEYEVLERMDGRTLVLFRPLTGRTHQLRVHAAHQAGLGHPIVGDTLYGQPADRLYLHAEYLEFAHPATGDTICLQREAEF